MGDGVIQVRLPATMAPGQQTFVSLLSTHMIEDRGLTGKQYESVNGL